MSSFSGTAPHLAAVPGEPRRNLGGPLPAEGGDVPFEGSPGRPDVVLALSDLILDPNGEVVLFNDSQLRSLELLAESPVVREGVSGRHVTVAGDDVSGFRFIAFANGLTLFFDPGLHVAVRRLGG